MTRCSVHNFFSHGFPDSTLFVVLAILLILMSGRVSAHEARPAHLEIREQGSGLLNINWTRPVRDGRILAIHPVFPADCRAGENIAAYQLQAVMHEKWLLNCGEEDLGGQKISISGLDGVISDVLLRFQAQSGAMHVHVLDRENPEFTIPVDAVTEPGIGKWYFRLGVSHILTGFDHLLFVLGLLLLIQGFWNLVKTITAFTLAHSISLFAAILGYVHVPTTPVEAVIALSIIFLACELLRSEQESVTRRLPWLIAAIFGLVHGLGFAGGLSEIGLPEGDIPLALLMFNIGVEAGQLVFVILATILLTALQKTRLAWYQHAEFITTYAIGSVAALWFIERVSGFY